MHPTLMALPRHRLLLLLSALVAAASCLTAGRIPPLLLHAVAQRADAPLRINCGFSSPSSLGGRFWEADVFYDGGSTFNISSAKEHKLNPIEATLRAFPADTIGCYSVPVAPGRYLVRLGFAYYNYDGKDRPPFFDVMLQDTLVETVDMATVQAHYTAGAYYSDYMAYASKDTMKICLSPQVSVAGKESKSPSPPLVNTIEILPVDMAAYDSDQLGTNVILSTYVRLNLGGPTISAEPADPGYRTWTGDVSAKDGNFTGRLTANKINGTGVAPDYLPEKMFQTARMAGYPRNATGFRMTLLPVDSRNMWYLRLYFAEIDSYARKEDREFDILLGSGTSFKVISDINTGFDILQRVPTYNALVVPIFFNFSQSAKKPAQDLQVGVRSRRAAYLPAMINGVELFEVIRVGSKRSQSGGLSTVELVAIIIGSILAFCILAGLLIFFIRSRRPRAPTPSEAEGLTDSS